MKLLLLLVFINININIFCKEEIITVYEHFRHGARSPLNQLSSSKRDYLNIYWEREGELNLLGMRMHIISGYQKRKQYNFLLNDNDRVISFTTNRNRTKDSLKFHLIGMYDEFNENLNDLEKYSKIFNPKNISTFKNANIKINENYINQNFDNFKLKSKTNINIFDSKQILYHDKYCPYYKEIKKQLKIKYKNLFDETINNFSIKYLKEFRNYINNSSFIFEDIDHLKKVCDSFVQAYLYNETWFNNNKFSDLYSIYEDCIIAFNVSMYYTEFTDEYFSVPISYYFLNYFYNNLKKAKNKDNDYKKYILFSGHDSTIAAIQQAFKYIFKDQKEVLYPYLSSSLILELIENKDNNKYYINYKLDNIEIFKIEYDKFIENIEKYILNDKEINKFCYPNKNNFFIYILIFILSKIFILIIIILIRKNKKTDNNNNNNSTELEDKFVEQK